MTSRNAKLVEALKLLPVLSPVRSVLRAMLRPTRRRAADRATRRATEAAHQALRRFPLIANPSEHALPAELVLSLTSYAGRFGTLPFTLKSLLDQSVRPDRAILWIGDKDWPALPDEVLKLRDFGLEIERCEDLGPYTKVMHALDRWPAAFIVTADDDQYYPPNWLETLTSNFDVKNPAILCRRAFAPVRDADGRMKPYAEWEGKVLERPPSARTVFPTGVGGVLYPPGCFADQVTDKDLFLQLAPSEDDLWLYWMGRLRGSNYRRVGPEFVQVIWPGSQEKSLYSTNRGGATDSQIRALERHFGCV